MKFIFTESGYQLFRYRGRSVLLCCVSLLLCGCIAFYIGSLSSNQIGRASCRERVYLPV